MKSSTPKDRVSQVKSSGHRRLTREELEIWQAVARSISPLHAAAQARVGPEPASAPEAPLAQRAGEPRRYEVAGYTPPEPRAREGSPAPTLMPLERRLRQKLRRGRSDVEMIIDLHGLHQAEAHRALRGFVANAQRQGVKLALVVTGKGSGPTFSHGLERETGVLRQVVPQWLRASDLRGMIVGFEEASPTHGGAGALYVRIRRPNRPLSGGTRGD